MKTEKKNIMKILKKKIVGKCRKVGSFRQNVGSFRQMLEVSDNCRKFPTIVASFRQMSERVTVPSSSAWKPIRNPQQCYQFTAYSRIKFPGIERRMDSCPKSKVARL